MRYTNGLGKRKQSIERELKRIKWNDQIKGADADVAAAIFRAFSVEVKGVNHNQPVKAARSVLKH